MAVRAPDECHWMMRHSALPAMMYRVPDYWAWLKQRDPTELRALYAHYRLQVQHLQLFCRGTHWLSKSVAHLNYLPVLREVFPDAAVIRLHRHPARAVPSLCSLAAAYRAIFSERIDRLEIGETILDMFVDGTRRMMAADFPSGDLADVHYADLVADPIGVVRHIYRELGYPWSPAFEAAMEEYLAQERGIVRPPHRYALADVGLSEAELLGRTSGYLDWMRQRGPPLADL
jgi:hypothetical protein